jgi:chain length determinant protein (polysaccharide antigen chain regulator)
MEKQQLDIPNYSQQGDEIDLFELFASLMQQWRWLVGIIVIGALLSVGIALSTPKQFEVSAKVTLPNASTAMLLTNEGYEEQSPAELFKQYHEVLVSRVNFDAFMMAGAWLSKIYPEGAGNKAPSFLNSVVKERFEIAVIHPKQSKTGPALAPNVIELKMMGLDEQLTARFINDYIEYTGKALFTKIKNDGQKMLAYEILNIKRDTGLLRGKAKMLREARIHQLKDALTLARTTGIINPDSVSLYSESSWEGKSGLTAGSLAKTDGMFLLGSKYLKGEIENLQKRVSDDPYIGKLPELFSRLEELNNMTFDFTGVQPYRIAKVAEVDGRAEKPKRTLIIVVGTMLSGFIAIFVALIMGAVKRRGELA